jgi:hypothetical protein
MKQAKIFNNIIEIIENDKVILRLNKDDPLIQDFINNVLNSQDYEKIYIDETIDFSLVPENFDYTHSFEELL